MDKDFRVVIQERITTGCETPDIISFATCGNFAPSIPAAIEWCKYRLRSKYPDNQDIKVVVKWYIDDEQEEDLRVDVVAYTSELTYLYILLPVEKLEAIKEGLEKTAVRTLIAASTIAPGITFTPEMLANYPDTWLTNDAKTWEAYSRKVTQGLLGE